MTAAKTDRELPAALALTYVWHGGKCFSVSTINRESSAVLAYGMIYAETIVWQCDPITKERGAMLWQGEASAGSLHTHLSTVKRIHDTGSPDVPEETGESKS